MKKTIFLSTILLTLSFTFIGCSDDDNPIAIESNNGGDRNGSETPPTNPEFNTDGTWANSTITVFESTLNVNENAEGADEAEFAFTTTSTSIGNTVLPTDFTATQILTGDITTDVVLNASEVYEIVGAIFIRDGASLTIPAGTFLFADPTNNGQVNADITAADVVIVNQGGSLNLNGTAASPIIFSSSSQVAGSWGGIVLLGNAPINLEGGIGNAEIADNVGEDLPYGGSDSNDNSGSLRYTILAYPGTQINTEAEFNGFSFYATGNGTTLEFLEVFQGQDDGFEWFGGTVNATNLFAQAFDDSFDWAEGFVGTLDNIIADQPNGADHCIEADNLNADNNATPRSNPTVMNATFNSSGDDDAVRLRRGTSIQLNNAVFNINGSSRFHFEVDDIATAEQVFLNNTTFTNIAIDGGNPAFTGNANN